jgi:hypothetical protein
VLYEDKQYFGRLTKVSDFDKTNKVQATNHRCSRFKMINDIQKAEKMSLQILSPLPGLREGDGGWVQIYNKLNYRISSLGLCRREIIHNEPAGGQNLYRKKGEGAKVLAYGKLQLLLLVSRLHFPSENRKSCPPEKGGFTPSKRSPRAATAWSARENSALCGVRQGICP